MILFDVQSARQHVTLSRDWKDGLQLRLDGIPQFSERWEHRYHEGLAVVPLLFAPAPRRVLICGGGDGLALARILRFPEVADVLLCDYDGDVTRIATTHPELARLNEGSMSDPRVTVVNDDAWELVHRAHEPYDVVIVDFPDPYFRELGRLYSVEFYERVRALLAPGGVVCTQTRATGAVAPAVRATFAEVFEHTSFFVTMGMAGFTLGSNAPLARRRPVPPWTRYLTEDLVDRLFVLPKDDRERFSPDGAEPVRGEGTTLVGAALADVWAGRIAVRYPYRENALWVVLHEGITFGSPDQVLLLVASLDRDGDLALLVSDWVNEHHRPLIESLGYAPTGKRYEHYVWVPSDRTRRTLEDAWAEWDDGSVTEIEVQACRASEDEEIRTLVDEYLATAAEHAFDLPHSRYDYDQVAWYAVTRDPTGLPVALFKASAGPSHVELELMYARRGPRQALLSGMLLLRHLDVERQTSVVDFLCATPEIARMVQDAGAERVRGLSVWNHPRAALQPLPEGGVLGAMASDR